MSAPIHDIRRDYPLLSFRYLEKGWGFKELDDEQRCEFLLKWELRSAMTWKELSQRHRHELGSERIPKHKIKPSIPEPFRDVDKFRVYRHKDNYPMAGVKVGDIYYVIWIDPTYKNLYDH